MALICWKWQDISVASTISTTRVLNSLWVDIQSRQDGEREAQAEKEACKEHFFWFLYLQIIYDILTLHSNVRHWTLHIIFLLGLQGRVEYLLQIPDREWVIYSDNAALLEKR